MRRATTIGLVVAASLLLAACFLVPGKFVSTLDVRRDGAFDFVYKGEIVLALPPEATIPVPLVKDDSSLTCFGPVPGAATPVAPPRVAPEARTFTPPVAHPCTPDERAKRLSQAKEMAANDTANRRRASAQVAELTGIDPSDPVAMRVFAADLAKQAGWRSVVYRGDGVFDVDFVQSGRLDRDFVFPVVPKATFLVPFVVIRKRADGMVLVSAPGFTANPIEALSRGFSAAAGGTTPKVPSVNGPQGSFTITSDQPSLTNNTEDGPTREGSRSRLSWTVSAAAHKVPEALIPLDR